MKIILIGVVVVASLVVAMGQTARVSESQFRAQQERLFDKAKVELLHQHRIGCDFADLYRVVGRYAWHATIGGTFGAYGFDDAAFKQAQRGWWITGTMKAGTSILRAVNRGIKFDTSNDGLILACTGCSEGDLKAINDKPEMKGYVPPVSPTGYTVGYMYKGPVDAKVVKVIDSTTLQLDKTAPDDVLQFDLSILPSDYIDMCDCYVGSAIKN